MTMAVWRFRPALPALVTILLTLGALLPNVWALPEHGDENQYAWSAAYFGGRVARLDFSPTWTHTALDPAWHPQSYWALTQPMGTRYVYALALGLTGAQVSPQPYWWPTFGQTVPPDLAALQMMRLPPATLHRLRLVSVLCASAGFALLALRWGWRGALAAALVLAVPSVRADLARAWAEGPLLLGFGICALTYGRRTFPLACALAALMKLTAIGVWPLLLWPRAVGRLRPSVALGLAAGLWSLLSPPSWYDGGPLYLGVMLRYRMLDNAAQAAAGYEGTGGLYFPTRYALPLLLGAALVCTTQAPRLLPLLSLLRHGHRTAARSASAAIAPAGAPSYQA